MWKFGWRFHNVRNSSHKCPSHFKVNNWRIYKLEMDGPTLPKKEVLQSQADQNENQSWIKNRIGISSIVTTNYYKHNPHTTNPIFTTTRRTTATMIITTFGLAPQQLLGRSGALKGWAKYIVSNVTFFCNIFEKQNIHINVRKQNPQKCKQNHIFGFLQWMCWCHWPVSLRWNWCMLRWCVYKSTLAPQTFGNLLCQNVLQECQEGVAVSQKGVNSGRCTRKFHKKKQTKKFAQHCPMKKCLKWQCPTQMHSRNGVQKSHVLGLDKRVNQTECQVGVPTHTVASVFSVVKKFHKNWKQEVKAARRKIVHSAVEIV